MKTVALLASLASLVLSTEIAVEISWQAELEITHYHTINAPHMFEDWAKKF
jgi:protein-L-isoaspartate O-methyltransferase